MLCVLSYENGEKKKKKRVGWVPRLDNLDFETGKTKERAVGGGSATKNFTYNKNLVLSTELVKKIDHRTGILKAELIELTITL